MFIYLYIYMSAIAGQTAEPNGLTFFERTLKYSGGNKGYKKFDIFFKNEKFLSTGFFYKNRFFSKSDYLKIPGATPGTIAGFQ